ncbi:hypothetical protein HCU01_17690 [Halomonas cupida]|uniref:Uncharacterized protein n=1 Tax=Halomonas cupida TaxID=44933 RepID=A0ABQ0WDX5_9GAMM|nr:hypothetical protein HCU01_17690 [Halomonas cupida]
MFHVKHREDYPPEWKPGLLWSACWAVVAQAWMGGRAQARAEGKLREGRVTLLPVWCSRRPCC